MTEFSLQGQVAINSDGAAPVSSAMLEVTSTTRGFLPPRMDSTARKAISSPAAGLVVYDTNTNTHWIYNGSAWRELLNRDQFGVTTPGGPINNTTIESDGTIRFNGNATVWDDIMVYPDATTRGGSNPPVWGGAGTATYFKNDGGTSQGVFLYMFSATQEQELYFTVQIPHSYKTGSILYPHVHWTTKTGTPSGTNVVWGLEYTIVAIGGNYGNTTTLTANSVLGSITISGTGQHLITSLGTISGTGTGISTVLVCRLFRAATDANDTFSNETGLLGFDIHFEKDTEGSRQEYVK